MVVMEIVCLAAFGEVHVVAKKKKSSLSAFVEQ